MIEQGCRTTDKVLRAYLSKDSANIESKLNTIKNSIQTSVDTALSSSSTIIKSYDDQLESQMGGNISNISDDYIVKSGTPTLPALGTWTKILSASGSTTKYRVEYIDIILDIPVATMYMPGQISNHVAIKEASFTPNSATNFTDIDTSVYTLIPPTLVAAAPGTGQVYITGCEPLEYQPAGMAPPESLLYVPKIGRKRIHIGKANQENGFSIWVFNNPMYPFAAGQFIQANLLYNVTDGGSV